MIFSINKWWSNLRLSLAFFHLSSEIRDGDEVSRIIERDEEKRESSTVSIMRFGINPYLSLSSPTIYTLFSG